MILMLVLIVQLIYITYQSCTQLNYQTCMKNTPNHSCVFLDNKCYQSYGQNFGCASSLNKNLCLIQNAKCQYTQKCHYIEQDALERIGCEWRQLTKEACTHIISDRCIYIQEELKCKQYLSPPTLEERCETQYNVDGMFMIVSPLLCSQIQDKACIWNPSNYLCTSEISKVARCDDLGLSKLACRQIITDGQNCIYSKQNKYCKEDCPFICQNNFLDLCDENMNQHACLGVESEACQFLDGKCQKIHPNSCINSKVNEKTCSLVESELCSYNPRTISCEVPSLLLLGCNYSGLNQQACVQLSQMCIFDVKCRTVDQSELFNMQCSDAVSKKTCLSIQTQLQNCQWNQSTNECQELLITKHTSCTSLKSVNGNSCRSVIIESCKYQKENCIIAEPSDQCEAPFINLIGCTSILKFQTPCQWVNNQCTKAAVTSDRSCESYTFVNPIVCSLYYKVIEDPNFICYVDEKFTYFDYTCRYDSTIMSCRSLRKEEFTTLPCGNQNLGLNFYACSLIQTLGQVCLFRSSMCIKKNPSEQYQLQCNIIKGNPSSCAYTTYGRSPCKFNLKTCGCLNTIDIKRDKCDTIGVNSIGCGLITQEQCIIIDNLGYYNIVDTLQFQCKKDDEKNDTLDCEANSPNQKLCLAITTPGQLCTWSFINQKCEQMQIDPSQPCAYYTNVNQNVCTQIRQTESSSNKGYCYYDPISSSCKPWTQDRKCLQSCCAEQKGINIHVCSAMTNFDGSYCYFDNYRCRKYEANNELDIQRIFLIFSHNYNCEQFNFKLCGLINPSLNEYFYCYQSSINDRCQTLLPNIYNQMNKSVFLASTVRSNLWTCIKIDQDNLKVRYDPARGKCESISETITCEQYQVNKQACLELTKESSCYWDEINFQCQETSRIDDSQIEKSLINLNACLKIKDKIKRFNNILFKCEFIQEITSTTQCTSLGNNYSYNQHACKQITDGTKCSYDSINRSCKLQTENIPNCDLLGQNRESCLGNTLGVCKWNQSEYKCMDTTDESNECDENLNKFACMKITKQNCYFDSQLSKCKPLTEIFTCDKLVEYSKILSRYFNQRSCTSLQNNEGCAYDVKNFQCLNFTSDKSKIIYNYTCTQFPMNIHLCLSHTQGSYCQYNQSINQCSNYVYVQLKNCNATNLNDDVRSATNLSRDVCIGSSESCTFNILTSTCQKFEYKNDFCSQLKAEGGYLYGAQACTKVDNKIIQQDFSSIEPIVCFSYQCNIEYYCTYNALEQGCQIMHYLEEERKKNEYNQNICQIKKRYLECDIKFNKFVCLHLTDVPCYFDPIKFQCLKLDETNNKRANCEQVSAAGCTYVETIGQFCYIQTKQFEPVACNSGMPTYQICSSNFTELPPIPIPGTFGEDLQYYNYYQSEYFFVGQIKVNANKCSILCEICYQTAQSLIRDCAKCGVIFDEEIRQCIPYDYNFGCDTPGMSRYLCELFNWTCIFQNYRCKQINSNSNTSQVVNNCNNTILNPNEFTNWQTKAKQCISNIKCAFIKENKFADKTDYKNITECNRLQNAQSQKINDLNNCTNIRNNQDCGSYFTSVNQCFNYNCRDITVTFSESNIFGTTNTVVNCDSSHYNKFYVKCECLDNQKKQCEDDSNTKYDQAIQNFTESDPCKQYILACEDQADTTDYTVIKNKYQIVPKQYCLDVKGTAVIYSESTNSCDEISSDQKNSCLNLNYDACVKKTNFTNKSQVPLYCGWKDGKCNGIQYDSYDQQKQLYKKCEYVNENSCRRGINAQCIFENGTCMQYSGQRCTNSQITNQLVCQQLQYDQCVFENGSCQSINNENIRKQFYACSKSGLNSNACLINTNQICTFDNQEQKCTQITDFSQVIKCEGLNVKGCTENQKIPCMWNWSETKCQDIDSTLSSCEQFLSKMPEDYLVNYKTCLKISSACIYKDKKCQTPQEEDGCSNQLYNKLGCTQKTNQFCKAIVDNNNVFCVEIGDFNQQCDDSFNYYACMKMLGCIWKDGQCQTVNKDTFLTQYSANPYICQNLKQKGTYFYNQANSKCELATQQIYNCTDPYINQETCLQLTNNFCEYLVNDDFDDYKDTTQRCLNYDKSSLYTQTCQEKLNYRVCANVVNSACVFKDGKCQLSQNLSCLQLSSQGVYASKQACAQTQDGFCAYDQINERCKVIDFQTKLCDIEKPCLCDTSGVNEQLCLSIDASQNKCEFKTESVLGLTISNCEYATQSTYKCSDNISMNQCILIGNCKYQNYQCSQLENNDLQTCVKGYEVSKLACTSALDVPCGYDLSIYKCMINPLDDISNIQYFNKLACVQSSIKKNLIFLNGQCQIAEQPLKCDDDVNLFACTQMDRGQECIFDQKCQFVQLQECEKNLNVNNPISCSKVISGPCKFKDYNCVVAIDDASECQYQGFNNLACIMPNLMTCQNCAQLLLNSQCSDVKSKSICLQLNSQCQWATNQCIAFNVQQQTCESLSVGVNIYTCYSVNMDDSIDQVCVHNKNTDKCIKQEVQQCQNLNSQKTCIFNTKLSCIWLNNKCLYQIPLKNQDYCTSFLGSNEFCRSIERFDASCELISGVCQEAEYKQENWQNFINRKGCLQQKLKYCYWQNKCICFDGQELLQQQQQLNCSKDLSFLMCLSIKTSGQYCQFQYGQCNQLILPQSLKWNQYQLINQNVCTHVDQYPVGYNQEKYSCKILKKIDDCSFPGLNIISCLSDILDYPCMWLNDRCQHVQLQRLLQQSYGKINAAYCYEMKDSVYYDGKSCQRVNEFTRCDAQGLSKAGCLSILFEPCRWISDDEGCIEDYPYNQCELNVGMVNSVFCKYVEIGQCKYDIATNSCKIAKFDTWIYSFEDQKCICKTQNCDFNKIAQDCILPSNQGINSYACTSIQGAIFNNYECQLVNTNSSCPKLVSANMLACKYVNDDCVFDQIEENCTSVSFNGVCEDISISQIGCQQSNCHYFNNQCTCKQLGYVQCLTYSPLECENNNLCYWGEGQCHIRQCQGLTDNCQSQVNCYRKLKNGKQVCEYAKSCEEVQLDSNIYSTCTEVFIDNKPCYPNSLLNSNSSCVTLKCEQFNNPVYCTSTIIGNLKISDYCIYIQNQCLPVGCNDIQNEDACNQHNGCYYVQNKENQKICQEFKTCESITTDYVNIQAQFICNKMEVKDVNENYNHCAWMEDRCVINPCQYLGIDQKICNGAHINNKYVCALDLNSLTCNVCEIYQKGCDCLSNDQYCSWNTNKQICQSIPCIKIIDQQNCLIRQDCQYEKTCLAKCSYHLNQQYCKENQCYWDSYNSYCAECDLKFCYDSSCQNTKCCQMRQLIYKSKEYDVCYPKCEKIVQSQCNDQCSWRVDLELCVYNDELKETNGNQ